jgi:hypothetical protein
MKKLLFLLLSTIFTVSMVQAQKPEVVTKKKAGWQKIGDANVDFKSDKDKFVLIGADKFKSLKIKVKDAPVHIEEMEVEFEGGVKENIQIKSEYRTGEKSRVIDLKNKNLEIKNVSFVYHTVAGSTDKKAEIELWGLK